MTVGERMKIRRKEIRLSVEELAKRLGKSKATVYRYENGDIENLPLDLLEPIAAALEVSPAYLMGWKEEIEQKPVEAAERHIEMIMDEDLSDIFEDFKSLDATKRKIVKDLVHSLAKT